MKEKNPRWVWQNQDASRGEEPPQASAAFGTLQKQWLQEAGETGRLQPCGMSLEKAARAKYLFLTNSGRDTQGDDKTKDKKSTAY